MAAHCDESARELAAVATALPPPARPIAGLLTDVDIRINGDRPWDMRVYDNRVYERILSYGTLGAGEAYMDGWWDAEALDDFFARVHRADPQKRIATPAALWLALKGRLFNRQTRSKSSAVAREHYDLGNDLYRAMLDHRMQYTCAYWKNARTLDEAQESKLHLICRKLGLAPGMTVLELGCGFGGFSHFAASQYGCEVVSYNISREQVAFARDWCRNLPVRVEERDYREAAREGQFDRVASIGLCEHVGPANYRRFLELAHGRLRPGGLFLLHTIGNNVSETSTDPWIDRYIFPNGVIPSAAQLSKAMDDLWVIEDWHNFGPDYDPTLMAWFRNFDRAWPDLRSKYNDRFYRMWKYYLMASAGAFRARKLQLWQIVLSKGDTPCYQPVR